jgi:diaminopimelate dehydrogenase
MPNYFADYDTTVNFISLEELQRDHMGIPHGGRVIRSGFTGFDLETKHTIEYSLNLESNPEFTGSVLVCFARAICRMAQRGDYGCKTAFDIAPVDLSMTDRSELIAHML